MDKRKLALSSNHANIPDEERKLLIFPTGSEDGAPLLAAEVHHSGMEWEEHEALAKDMLKRWNDFPEADEVIRKVYEALSPGSSWTPEKLRQYVFTHYIKDNPKA